MNSENKLIIEQLNKFGRVPQTHELLQIIEQLQQENKQLKEKLDCDLQWAFRYEKQVDNWNKLREYIGTEWYCFDNESVEFEIAKDILDKMQELESRCK